MGQPTTEITSEMLINECSRILGCMEAKYPELVEKGKLSTWERDHRYNCLKNTLSILRQLQLLEATHKMTFTEILKSISAK